MIYHNLKKTHRTNSRRHANLRLVCADIGRNSRYHRTITDDILNLSVVENTSLLELLFDTEYNSK